MTKKKLWILRALVELSILELQIKYYGVYIPTDIEIQKLSRQSYALDILTFNKRYNSKTVIKNISVQSLSHVQLFATSWTTARQTSLFITDSWSLLKLMSIKWVMSSNHPLLSLSLSAFNLSQHQGLSIESVLSIRWSKYWSFSFSISTSNEYSGLISFRIDWLDLLAVQETLKDSIKNIFNNY